jgi:PKD repeat protein
LSLNGGQHTIVVTAYNSYGQTNSAPFVVAPSANAGGPYSGQAGTAIIVTGAASNAPTGTLTNYRWNWGDGTAATSSATASASHIYSTSGTFTVTLTVTDNAGATASATTTATIGAASTLPSPWQTQYIGTPGILGSASYSAGVFTVSSAGADIWSTADAFRLVYQPLNGDGQIVARVTSMVNTSTYAKAGVMIRESLAADSKHTLVSMRPSGQIDFLVRSTTGGTTANIFQSNQPAPAWVKLARSGSTIVASVSANGSTWTVVGSANVTMTSTVLVGLAVGSVNATALNVGTFDNVTFTPAAAAQPPAAPSSPTPANGATAISTAASLTWSAIGATSYDVSFGTTNPPATVATALTTASYRPASMNAGTTYYWRILARNSAGTTTGPVWSFTTASAPTGGTVPAPWLTQDIGPVGLTGSATYTSGTFTVEGSGADIWGASDAFHFVHQPLNADTEIVARLVNLTNTHQYAKAGVMVRAGLDSTAAHVLLNAIPGGPIEMVARASQGGTGMVVASAVQSVPAWLKLARSGSTVTGYVSSNGSTWTQVGSTTVSLGAAPYVGLAVTSHDTTRLNTATFDSVTVGTGSQPPPTTSSGDVVIYASDTASIARRGSWVTASDSLSPGGIKLTTPDQNISTTNAPLATPQHYLDVTFSADAGKQYRVWLRLRARNNQKANDSVWVQFSDSLVNGSAMYRMNSTSGLLVNLATTASASSLQAWGWKNNAYWLSQPTAVTFATTGTHTMRIQIREDGVELDQIVLSPVRYFSNAPGGVSNDTTVVSKQ